MGHADGQTEEQTSKTRMRPIIVGYGGIRMEQSGYKTLSRRNG